MAVKFPLEMKNGVKARNINELKENFDIERIIGYFLDGKLKAWLEARYYEEELEAIEQLDSNDTNLANKLCDIFEIEHELEEEINPEEIVKRNERISKLKQFTTDENIINNVDFVAFDQEELGELYDNGVEKIYLCEGSFVIPKSKSNLEYILIEPSDVKGMEIASDVDETDGLDVNSNAKIDEIMEKNFSMNSFNESDYNKLKAVVSIGDKSIDFEQHLKNLKQFVPAFPLYDLDRDSSTYEMDYLKKFSSKSAAQRYAEERYDKYCDYIKDTFRLNCNYYTGTNGNFEHFINNNIDKFNEIYKMIQICRAVKGKSFYGVDLGAYHRRIKDMIITTGEHIDVSGFYASNYLTHDFTEWGDGGFFSKKEYSNFPSTNGLDRDFREKKEYFSNRVKENLLDLIDEAFGAAIESI